MRLYIIRHGKATEQPQPLPEFPRPAGYTDDFDRPLSSRGEHQSRYLAQELKAPGRPVNLILSSRYPRAIQTAEIIRRATSAELKTSIALEVDHPVPEVLALIEEHQERRSLVLVGHNPQLGELIGVLAPNLRPAELILKTGELVALDVRPAHPVGSARPVLRLRLGEESQPAPLRATG